MNEENEEDNVRERIEEAEEWLDINGLYRLAEVLDDNRAKSAEIERLLLVNETLRNLNVDELANVFMGWKLPDDFAPDCGISFKKVHAYIPASGPQVFNPIGTNLFTLQQAKQMFDYVIAKSIKNKL